MSTEGAGPRQDAEAGSPAGSDNVVPASNGDVHGISDLIYRIITPFLRHATLHRVGFIVLVALAGVCVLATGVRLSALPLVPIPLFAVAGYALRRVRSAGGDRSLLVWSSLCFAAAAIGFWLMSVMGRWVS
ncbi:MAG TPA: hypothetical protein VJT49_21875 [Amycolatopsis sp.]|uniref:hypothetical protein n=1 Tax=Amycolatopsis sp. TaxID=37632 RepID=UPI002B4933CA|nr:hypothetical protein [Amycolatopsis sp.]HKS47709.1 hypothetical protein [Amycolatopsis sp.]